MALSQASFLVSMTTSTTKCQCSLSAVWTMKKKRAREILWKYHQSGQKPNHAKTFQGIDSHCIDLIVDSAVEIEMQSLALALNCTINITIIRKI